MFIKLTNATPDRLGDPLVININAIVSAYENHIEGGGSLSTIIYSNKELFWIVEESLAEVEKKINIALGKMTNE